MVANLNKCVWMCAGLLTYRLCDRNYECDGCPVEDLFHPSGKKKLEVAPVGGIAAAPDRFHDAQHLWMRVLPGGRLQIGLDPMAARLLRSMESCQVPRPGAHLKRGDEAMSFEVAGRTVPFASPVTGDVLRSHVVHPGRFHSVLSRPYSRAWLIVMSVPRLERQLAQFSFGREVGLALARDWSRFQEECIGLAAGTDSAAPALPDGGEIDLDRLWAWAGSETPALLRRWIGIDRVRTGRSKVGSLEKSPETPSGKTNPPQER